jgi:hypothetical protein
MAKSHTTLSLHHHVGPCALERPCGVFSRSLRAKRGGAMHRWVLVPRVMECTAGCTSSLCISPTDDKHYPFLHFQNGRQWHSVRTVLGRPCISPLAYPLSPLTSVIVHTETFLIFTFSLTRSLPLSHISSGPSLFPCYSTSHTNMIRTSRVANIHQKNDADRFQNSRGLEITGIASILCYLQ